MSAPAKTFPATYNADSIKRKTLPVPVGEQPPLSAFTQLFLEGLIQTIPPATLDVIRRDMKNGDTAKRQSPWAHSVQGNFVIPLSDTPKPPPH